MEARAARINRFMDDNLKANMQRNGSLTAGRSVTALQGVFKTIFAALCPFFLLLCVVSTVGCAWLDEKQRSIIYRPTTGVPADFVGLRAGDERYFLEVAASQQESPASAGDPTQASVPQRIEMWWLPHTNPQAPTLLYYHGTFRNLYQNIHKINALREAGFAVLAVDYRGWGQSSAIIPSEQSILQDAQLAFDELRRREVRPSQRVVYGHSMGSGVAVDIASRLQTKTDYGAIILESALTSFADVAVEASWLGRLVGGLNNERFASIDKISQVKAPLLMLHGGLDTTVPPSLGNKLFAAANAPKQWLVIQNAKHSDLHEAGGEAYQAAVQGFTNLYVLGLQANK
jgi:uncharacterized protein